MFSFKGKLIQYLGCVQRSEITPVIYDYRDRKIEYLNRLFLKRNTYYRHLDQQASLFDDAEITEGPTNKTFTVDKKIKIPIDQSINQDLNIIRNKGRQNFLEKRPENFSRLIHDYSDERKGLLYGKISWKKNYSELYKLYPPHNCRLPDILVVFIFVREIRLHISQVEYVLQE